MVEIGGVTNHSFPVKDIKIQKTLRLFGKTWLEPSKFHTQYDDIRAGN